MATPADYHYSATVQTNDLAVLHCLRALADYAEKSQLKKVAWGGTTADYWRQHGHMVKFHFSSMDCRETFLKEATRVLPDMWKLFRTKDDDPPTEEERP